MFSEGLAQLGNVSNWFKLEAGKASNNQLFWEGIQDAFTGHFELYNKYHFENFKKLGKSFVPYGTI